MSRRSEAALPAASAPVAREGGRRSVTRRVTVSYLVVTLAFSLVTAWNVFALRAATQEAELMRSGYLPLALALRDAVLGQETWSVQLNHVTAAKNPAAERVWFDSWLAVGRPRTFLAVRDALSLAFGNQSEVLQRLGHRLDAETTEIETALAADRELIGKLFDALQSRETELAQQLRDELVRRSQEGRRRLNGLEREVKGSVDALLDDARARERQAAWLLWVSASFTVLVGLWVAWNARRLLAPLGAVTERARAVTRGDLTPHALVASNDEIGELAATFESMVAAIARANAELLSSERLAAIGKMAAQVTHEVRNPLSSLALNVELLEEELGAPEGEVAALLKAVKLEVERLIQLSEKYLSLARRSRPDFQEEDLGSVVSEAVASAQPELAQHEIKSQLQIQEGLPPAALDEAQIRQVMLNLIRNAREAMSEGGELLVGVRALQATPPRAPETLEISVADSGRGMDEQTRQHLFEPFFTTKRNGNGLGLAITQEIVEAHGGKIRCERRDPRGTRFVIELPIRPPALLAGSQAPPPPEPS
ncbi:MAG TPA: ATP-binding protein [Polyangiaceae bacterium]|nr:ATP-binding protein [Polyangiaceae bacterium]